MNAEPALRAGRYVHGLWPSYMRLEDFLTVAQRAQVVRYARRVRDVSAEDTFPVIEALVARAKGWS